MGTGDSAAFTPSGDVALPSGTAEHFFPQPGVESAPLDYDLNAEQLFSNPSAPNASPDMVDRFFPQPQTQLPFPDRVSNPFESLDLPQTQVAGETLTADMNAEVPVYEPPNEPFRYTGADTNMMDRPGNLYDSFNTYDKFTENAPGILAPGAVTMAGLGSMADANYYKDNLSGYEKMMAERRKGYGETVRSIQDSYARAGRDAPTGLYGTDWTVPSYAGGGIAGLTRGAGDGTSDSIPAIIDNQQRARLSTDEFVVPADVVSHLGNGSTKAGAETLYAMMNRIRDDRTASKSQPKDINPRKYVPA